MGLPERFATDDEEKLFLGAWVLLGNTEDRLKVSIASGHQARADRGTRTIAGAGGPPASKVKSSAQCGVKNAGVAVQQLKPSSDAAGPW